MKSHIMVYIWWVPQPQYFLLFFLSFNDKIDKNSLDSVSTTLLFNARVPIQILTAKTIRQMYSLMKVNRFHCRGSNTCPNIFKRTMKQRIKKLYYCKSLVLCFNDHLIVANVTLYDSQRAIFIFFKHWLLRMIFFVSF